MALEIKPIELKGTTLQSPSCDREGCCNTSENGAATCRTSSKRNGSEGWKKIGGGAMFVVACALSPCCAPLVVPLVLAVVAGTPIAVWAGQNLGWVYGGLTLLSVVSAVLGYRWLKKPKKSQQKNP